MTPKAPRFRCLPHLAKLLGRARAAVAGRPGDPFPRLHQAELSLELRSHDVKVHDWTLANVRQGYHQTSRWHLASLGEQHASEFQTQLGRPGPVELFPNQE